VTPAAPPTPATPSKYQTGFDTSLNRLQDVAGGNSEIDRKIANRNLRIYDTGAATDVAIADQQNILQNNIPESARAALGAEARSAARSGRSELIGGLAQSEQERALGANQAAGQMAMQGMAFEEDKKRYGDNQTWKAYDAAIAAGSFDTAAAQYKAITGKDISMDQMKTYQNYMNTKNAQDLRMGDISIDAAKFNLDSGRMQSMISDINNGVPLDTINKTYGTTLDQTAYNGIGEKYKVTMDSLRTSLGTQKTAAISDAINKGTSLSGINSTFGTNLTMADYTAMMDATPLGERTWERNMSYAKTLLEAGGSSNITAAAGIFNQAFPGTGIDFSKLITADNAATVNKGMSQLSDLVASGMDYDEAIAVMKKNGTLTMLGMEEGDVEKLYRGMKTNAIDEQWKTITESDWYKTQLTDAQRADMKDFFTAVLSGELDYSVQKEYTVTAKDGTKSTMYFNTEADANAYGAANTATMVSTGKSKVTPRTSVLETNTTGGTTSTTKRTEPLGTVIVEGGKIKQVIADGATQEIVPDVDEAFTDNNIKIINAGEKDNQYYKTIFDKQLLEISGGRDLSKGINAPSGDWIRNFNKGFDEYKYIPFENPVIQKLKKDIEEGSKNDPYKLTLVKNGNSWDVVRV